MIERERLIGLLNNSLTGSVGLSSMLSESIADYLLANGVIVPPAVDASEIMRGEWISVKDRLPEDDKMVLVWAVTKAGRGNVNRAYHDKTCWHGSGSMAGVTHWMPLPKPPREE